MPNVTIDKIVDGGDGMSFTATGTHVRSNTHYLHAALVPQDDPGTEIPFDNIAYAITNKNDLAGRKLWHLFFEATDPLKVGDYWFRIYSEAKPMEDDDPEAEVAVTVS